MILLDGKKLQIQLMQELKERVSQMQKVPSMVIIQVGDNPASNTYIKGKIKFGKNIGVVVQHHKFENDISEEALLNLIDFCNKDDSIGGVVVQLPLPQNLDKMKLLNSILPEKDIDGLGVINNGKLIKDDPTAKLPATPKGVITLLENYGIELECKNAVVIGRSQLVGLPLSVLLTKKNATVTIAHSHTIDLQKKCLDADIILSACGCPLKINKNFVKPGAIVVDVGITGVDGKIVGDVDFEDVKDIVYAVSPVPGGVGPMTILSLFQNLLS
ncbi:MAG: bifunctional 5,10-methylenetetrahydrofolate dehydrogenase/5,10-methenyltetrahydrofolate cyclohydrolase [bacterium]